MGGIDSNKPVPEALERIHLEGGLNAQNEALPLQL